VDPKIFITYSSKDQKVARTICTALENRGLICWISSRNVKPGQNYQEQIVRAIRASRVMVLVFTVNANNSNEIKKELALASQNNLVVIPVRIEDVAPNEAFAYEFATRQWIDLFEDWEKSMAELVELIAAILNDPPPADRPKASPGLPGDAAAPAFFMAGAAPTPAITPAVPFMQRPEIRWVMIAVLAVVVAAVVAYTVVIFSQRPSSSSVAANVGTPPPPPTPRPTPAPAQPPVVPAAPAPSAPPPPPAAAAASAGALAVALPADVAKSGFSYGYSNNNTDEAHAQAAALNACRTTKDAANDVNLRSLCKVVLNYSNKCIAVSMDPQAGTPGVGWALANDLQTAERQALAKCQETAGPGRRAACVLDHSACDGNAK
jgi:flagellar basal body-associated protein FliL